MENKKISELAKQIRGVSYKPSDLHTKLDSQSVILLRANNISDGLINFDDVVYVDKCKVSQNQYLCDGDILICASSGSKHLVGKAAAFHSQIDCTFGAFCKVVRPHSDLIDYLEVYFQSHIYRKKISEVAMGANINNIRNEHIDALELPVGCPEENATFTKTVHAIMKIIRVRQRQLKKLDELVKSRFIELFGDPEQNPMVWTKQPLSEIIINANNGMARRGNDPHGSIVMRLVELQDGHIDYSTPNRIVLTDTEKGKYLLRENDFLFARVNGNPEYVGRCAVFHEIGEPVYHNDHIIRVHFDDTVLNGAFASALINSAYGKRQMRGQIKTSAGQYTISQDGIGAITAILPPLELQEQFAAFVEQTDKSKFVIQQALDKAQLLFDSLMQKYFG